ncbi:hypothetical protein [Sphingomonas sp. PP-CE-1G-424]|uniref:hypothetical protein n=1 Tax=Sphingomonas sp. PP-CE-1G-424 TaxID=2135658 RepID=UPI0010566B0F|nr:hypothetical protein [Sphingomonas sp. PP-CE-1G-424]
MDYQMMIAETSINLIHELDLLAGEVLFSVSNNDPESANTIARYREIMRNGALDGNAQEAFREANLLTTVNKGVADREREEDDPAITSQARALSAKAIHTARSLRHDLGIPY